LPDAELIERLGGPAPLRELSPYPAARRELDGRQLVPETLVRHDVWRILFEANRSIPFTVPWHLGSRLEVQLGNEMSRDIVVHGYLDPNEFALLDRVLKPGSHVLDIGANEGAYTIFAAAKVGASGRVWAIEPSARELARLRTNVGLNDAATVDVVPCAIGDRNAETELKIAADSRSGHNTLGEFVWDGVTLATTQRVPLRTLDTIVAEGGIRRVDVIKMDIEGAEGRLLLGGRSVIETHRPLVLFEASARSLRQQGSSIDGLLAAFRSTGYGIFAFDHVTGRPTPYAPGHSGDNLIAAPDGCRLPEYPD
jgi:FkbM family methyltransferase